MLFRSVVNPSNRTVKKNGDEISLSLREFDLLKYLCEHKNKAIPKDELLSEVWGAFCEVETSTLTVHIRWLREKLEDDPNKPQFIFSLCAIHLYSVSPGLDTVILYVFR